MPISLNVNGKKYTDWTDIEVERSLDNFPSQFSFVSTYDNSTIKSFPIKDGDLCEVFLNNDTILIRGYVEIISTSYGAGQHSVSITGRSWLCDLVDSTVNSEINIKLPASIESVVGQILELSGFNIPPLLPIPIEIVSDTDIEDFTENERVVAEVGESIISVIDRYCRKRQLFISDGRDGTLILFRGNQGVISANIQSSGSSLDNVKYATVRRDSTKRYNQYKIHSQQNASTIDPFSSAELDDSVSGVDGIAFDAGVRSQRRLNIMSETSDDATQCQDRATWQANINRARAFSYSPTVQGNFTAGGEVYDINRLMTVIDRSCDINSELLINSVKYKQGLNGTTTDLSFTYRDAYTLTPEQPSDQKSTAFEL
jgi:prophage tail gpP-like protein